MREYIVVFVTVKNKAEAGRIAELLISKKLAACVNIINPVNSIFWWAHKLDSASEVLLIIKTKRTLFKKLEQAVKLMHSYEVPEIIALPIVLGSKKYLDWIKATTL